MSSRIFTFFTLLTLLARPAFSAEQVAPGPLSVDQRSLKICVAADAPAEVRRAAEAVLSAVVSHPLLLAMAGKQIPSALTDGAILLAANPQERAFHHLVLVGLPGDPLIAAAWQREARLRADGGLFLFGFGHLSGDLGWIESDRNPFLHSRAIQSSPFETELLTITGNTPAGVALAAETFLRQGLINGVVAKPGWTRPEPSLLQRDPLPPDFLVPALLPPQIEEWTRIGYTQASEDEYRGVLADTGTLPREIWRAKYHRPGVWDGAGAACAFASYSAGLHRRAYGNTLWAAQFASEEEATAAVPKIAVAARMKRSTESAGWEGEQPPYGSEKESPGRLTLQQNGSWVTMCTLPLLKGAKGHK